MTDPMAKAPSDQQVRIARNLAQFRKELGLSQPKMGQVVGVPANTWVAWETGRRTPKGDMIFRIADAFDRPAEDLIAENPPAAVNPIAPCFGLAVIDEDAPTEMVKRASTLIKDLNREHRKLVLAQGGSPGHTQTEREKVGARAARALGLTPSSQTPVAKRGRSGTPRRSK
jgi:transcriptional regulator with XRE-family HTH domain